MGSITTRRENAVLCGNRVAHINRAAMSVNKRKFLLFENSYLKYKFVKRIRPKRSKTNIIYLERHLHGEFHHLYQQLRSQPAKFKEYARMLPTTFDYIVKAIKPAIPLISTNFQIPISVEERLMVTLR